MSTELKLIRNGDLFTSSCQVIVNPVNCVGVMGAGLAKSFKHRYPDMFTAYQYHCGNDLDNPLKPGMLLLYTKSNPWVLNFPTKLHWRDKSRLCDIDAGMRKLVQSYKHKGIKSVAFPMLGCGLGGLSREDVQQIIHDRVAEASDLEAELYI